MAASKEAIFLALETSIFAFPEMPGRWEVLDFPGVRAHATPQISHPIGNLVGVAALTEANADAGIAKVLAQAGQVLTNLGLAIQVNPAVTVRQATPEDRDALIRVYATAYPLPQELAAVWTDVLPRATGGRHYLAFLEGVEEPVAVASMFPFPTSTVAVMQGAATLHAYRGQGVYTALMATRLADARAMGMEAAILQADRTTSAPICANLGFKEVCSIDLYAWGNG